MTSISVANAFSVDLEDWFQGLTSTNPLVDEWPRFESRVVPATQKLLAILRRFDVQATFFVLGYVADQHPDLIRAIHAAGHEIGVHGYYHRFVYRLSPDEFEQEVARSIEAVEDIVGVQPIGHRAPYFSVNAGTPWAFERLETLGLRYDSSVFPTRNMLYGFPGAPRFPYRIPERKLMEMPASTVQVGGMILPMAGGFYTRALPYWVTQWAIRRLNRQGQPAILYVHPWELDLEQNYGRVTARERITHYYGRRSLEGKLHRLFSEFRFTTMRDVLDSMLDSWQDIATQPEAQAA
jgi:polysaccharide deacetylase family protein (PEP-CTERM system associated)